MPSERMRKQAKDHFRSRGSVESLGAVEKGGKASLRLNGGVRWEATTRRAGKALHWRRIAQADVSKTCGSPKSEGDWDRVRSAVSNGARLSGRNAERSR